MHVCMYCMYCMHCMSCMYCVLYVYLYVCMYVCMYGCMHVCKYVCMYVCVSLCMSVCMYVCTYVCACACIVFYYILRAWIGLYCIVLYCVVLYCMYMHIHLNPKPQTHKCDVSPENVGLPGRRGELLPAILPARRISFGSHYNRGSAAHPEPIC